MHKDKYKNSREVKEAEFQEIPGVLWKARVVPTNDFEYCSPPEGMELSNGDLVVISTRYGRDLARLLGPLEDRQLIEPEEVRLVHRKTDNEDMARRAELEKREEEAFHICRRKIAKLGLTMKLVSAHYIFDEQKVMFFFTAENRVDFRELVKELVAHFRMRIELRQIGVRDESRTLGGAAVCGRQYCCHSITEKLEPVSIKMAKDQNLSLNSQKISGPCGRLLCCLAYEHGHYSRERKKLPREGGRVTYEGVKYKVTEVNIFKSTVQLTDMDGMRVDIPASRLEKREDTGWFVRPEEASHAEEPEQAGKTDALSFEPGLSEKRPQRR
ncbi:MAG: hypothetical protein CSA76_03205 [Spirochaetales bacterium]|nr:MAG: hypothetical protein CSA76_03205 [Spirochaetales bacterium]